jgi:type VI secretion system protein ImpL
MPWLLVNGEGAQINAVAPGLKQAGVLQVADTIWYTRPRTASMQRCGASNCGGYAVSALSMLWCNSWVRMKARRQRPSVCARCPALRATSLGRARNRSCHGGSQGQAPRTIEALGARSGRAASQSQREPRHVRLALQTLEDRLAKAGIQRCVEPFSMPYLARVSSYFSGQRVRIMESWAALHASKWRRATLTGVLFAPLYPVLSLQCLCRLRRRHWAVLAKWSRSPVPRQASRPLSWLRLNP